MRKVVAGVCPKHGYYEGSFCDKCDISGVGEVFYTSKDKLWEFTDYHITGKPVEIRTKGQYERLLKEHNKYQITSPKDVEATRKIYERNLKDNQKKEIHEAVVSAYKDIRAMNGDKRRIFWRR